MRVVEVVDVNSVFDMVTESLTNNPSYIQSQDARNAADFAIENLLIAKDMINNLAKEVSTRRYRDV